MREKIERDRAETDIYLEFAKVIYPAPDSPNRALEETSGRKLNMSMDEHSNDPIPCSVEVKTVQNAKRENKKRVSIMMS